MRQKVVIALVSGGPDSLLALELLLQEGYKAVVLHASGKEERDVAVVGRIAEIYGVESHVLHLSWLDETTYDFVQLIRRNMCLLGKALRLAWKHKAKFIAIGAKDIDSKDVRLWWIPPFIIFCLVVLMVCGLKPLFPVAKEK